MLPLLSDGDLLLIAIIFAPLQLKNIFMCFEPYSTLSTQAPSSFIFSRVSRSILFVIF